MRIFFGILAGLIGLGLIVFEIIFFKPLLDAAWQQGSVKGTAAFLIVVAVGGGVLMVVAARLLRKKCKYCYEDDLDYFDEPTPPEVDEEENIRGEGVR